MIEKVKVTILFILLFANISMLFAIRANGKHVDETGQVETLKEIVAEDPEDEARAKAYQIAIKNDAQMEATYLAVSIAESKKENIQGKDLNFTLNENETESTGEQNNDYTDSNENDMKQDKKSVGFNDGTCPYDDEHEDPDANETEEPDTEAEDEAENTSDDSTETYLGEFKFTYYCPCVLCCGKEDGITASGVIATEGRTIAVDPSVIPYGSRLKVVFEDGFEAVYVAEDCGGSIKNNRIDIFVSSHSKALELGTNHGSVYLLNEG